MISMMQPHEDAGENANWEAAERIWNSAFPSDYRWFMEIYGLGAIENCLAILAPDGVVSSDAPDSGMLEETENARGVFYGDGATGGPIEAAEQIICWGVDSGSDLLCWLSDSGDPDRWPVLVWDRASGNWTVYECGMVEFLCKVFAGEFDECPLSVADIWQCERPRFVHWRLERSRRQDGLDPVTGEPEEWANP
ncbi:hypothetical protein C7C46_30885 [Streptomyces tateyamensis]|uniref:SMI1/KNR4 family protein n=2 Tax=Streptomyces tateyamensis TaxID=565073 RepID=A0A2V4NTK8_9ACTN|nr:hypothetical protein C7C46_30885 [Streptomyces tateyamensis]